MSGLERHFTAKEVSKLWHLSEDCIRAIFRNTPGVLRLVQPARRGKRCYVSIRIPESILLKRHSELHGKAVSA